MIGLLGGVSNDGDIGELRVSAGLGVEGLDSGVSGVTGVGSKF